MRLQLIILVLIATIPALGITLYSGIEQRNQARLYALDDAIRLARGISKDHDQLIQNAHQILFTLSKISEVHQQDKATCRKTFAEIMKQSKGYTALFAAKPNGDVFASSLPITHPVNFADRQWFQRLLKTCDFVIGEYLIGRISGKPTVVLAYPVLDDIGNLKAALGFGLNLDWLNQTAVKSQLLEGTSVSVIDSNGTILFRHPDPEKFFGKSMSEVPIVKVILTKREGAEETVDLGGVPRLFGFTSLGKGVESVHVAVGIPSQIALAKADWVMKRNLAFLGLISLLALAAAWFIGGFFIIHPVNRLLGTTKQLANGDLTVHIGFPYGRGEIGQLTQAFDDMATSLKQHEDERKRAEEALQSREEEAKRLAQENAIVAEIGRVISLTLNIEEVYERFAEEVRKLIPFDRISINIINPGERTATIAYTIGVDVTDRRSGDIFPLAGSFTEEVTRLRSGLLIQTEDMDELKNQFLGLLPSFQAGLRSMMSVPLFSKDQIIGCLHIRSLEPDVYTISDLQLAQRVGNQIAGAIANAQLFAEHEHSEKDKATIQEQLRQSQKMETIGQLAGGIAHDFNNLLTVIRGYSQLSLKDLQKNDPLWEKIEEISKAADRASELTNQLLAISRRQMLEFKVIDLNSLIQSTEKMLRRMIREDIELVINPGEDLGRVKVDPGQIWQVIMNLAVNARDAMPSGGRLILGTENFEMDERFVCFHIGSKVGRYVRLRVTDTGCGMSKEVRERVFEPFFTTKENGKGTGLGLSTVYGIMKQSGGYVWVSSELGRGTSVEIYLPRVDESVGVLKEEVKRERTLQGDETILVVEDNDTVRKLVVQILRIQGYKVLEALHGGDAFGVCERHPAPIHLVITDVVMPEMGGLELVERLRQVRQDFRVLYMSGYTDESVVSYGIQEGKIEFIHKPFTVEGLAKKIREVLDK